MDLFSLVARLTLDRSDYEKGVDDAKGSFSKLRELFLNRMEELIWKNIV